MQFRTVHAHVVIITSLSGVWMTWNSYYFEVKSHLFRRAYRFDGFYLWFHWRPNLFLLSFISRLFYQINKRRFIKYCSFWFIHAHLCHMNSSVSWHRNRPVWVWSGLCKVWELATNNSGAILAIISCLHHFRVIRSIECWSLLNK